MSEKKQRPLSPHASIYRPPAAMMTSIMHRISACAMSFIGAPMLVWWLWSLSEGPSTYQQFTGFASSWLGTFILFGLSWCFFQHLASGIRHLIMDIGAGYELKTAQRSALATFAISIVLTLAFWMALTLK